jgi:hypothetical protein
MSESNKNGMNEGTVSILTSLLEIFATARSALSTYAVAMAVTNGDMTFSLFTTATVELALVLSMLAIGYDVISPVTAIVALGFSLVMQWTEITLLQGAIDEHGKNLLRMSLAFAPSAVLFLGILRRLVTGNDHSLATIIGTVRGLFGNFKRKPNDNGTSAQTQAQTSFALDANNAPNVKANKRKRVKARDDATRNGTLPNA